MTDVVAEARAASRADAWRHIEPLVVEIERLNDLIAEFRKRDESASRTIRNAIRKATEHGTEVARLRSVVAGVEALVQRDNCDIESDIEAELENAHGASHYECCFNAIHLAWPSANAVKRRLRFVLSDTKGEAQ